MVSASVGPRGPKISSGSEFSSGSEWLCHCYSPADHPPPPIRWGQRGCSEAGRRLHGWERRHLHKPCALPLLPLHPEDICVPGWGPSVWAAGRLRWVRAGSPCSVECGRGPAWWRWDSAILQPGVRAGGARRPEGGHPYRSWPWSWLLLEPSQLQGQPPEPPIFRPWGREAFGHPQPQA